MDTTTREEAQQKILNAIADGTDRKSVGSHIRDLAEAWAWLERPGNGHGGSVVVKSG